MRAITLLPVTALALAACSGDSSFNELPDNTANGTISIEITDAPVDDVSEVRVAFDGVTLKPQGGDPIEIIFDPAKDFDLLALQDGVTATLLPGTTVPAGPYSWVRLAVNEDASYAMTPTGQKMLRIPSGSQTGLQLAGGITVTQDQAASFVIDWDLRKALVDPVGQPDTIILRPALRITDLSQYGTLSGTIIGLVDGASCDNDLAADTGNAVYLFEGSAATPNDIQDTDRDPFVTATVTQNGDGDYVYSIDFLPEGEYTAAFTCTASNDDPAEDDNAEDEVDPFAFAAVVSNVGITADETTTVDFQ